MSPYFSLTKFKNVLKFVLNLRLVSRLEILAVWSLILVCRVLRSPVSVTDNSVTFNPEWAEFAFII